MKKQIYNFRFFIFVLFSLILLLYMLWPGPSNITDFKPLPYSYKSRLEGDTIQIPNVSAYFSDNYRSFVVPYYSQNYQKDAYFFLPPLRLNYPPEYSWTAIKVQTDSTYLEELVYPLRDSLFVNGMEPLNPDRTPKYWGAIPFEEGGRKWDTKTTLRFYPSTVWVRMLVWMGICSSVLLLYKSTRRIIS